MHQRQMSPKTGLVTMRYYALVLLEGARLLVPVRAVVNALRYLLNFNVLSKNRRFRMKGSPDGLPLPPPRLIHDVSGVYDQEAFYENGRLGAECIRRTLAKNGLAVEKFGRVLDFGCGCGRVMRHWANVRPTRFHGSDYNPRLVAWCRENLPFAEFNVNGLAAPLPYADGQFDFLYTISVFTHLPEEMQHFWINELRRVLKVGGHALLTLLGIRHSGRMVRDEMASFSAGKLVVRHSAMPGTNTCIVFHPEAYVRTRMIGGFEIVDFIPGGAEDASFQDVYLMRRVA